MSATEDKMYYIARHYNYLNKSGNVKAMKSNEKGYAKIKEIVRGCSLFVHHMNDDQLYINLLVSPAARTRYELPCKKAVDVFKTHFQSDVQGSTWINSRGGDGVHDRYCVDVTRISLPDLMLMIESIRVKIAGV